MDSELAAIWLLQAEEAFTAKNLPKEKQVATATLSLSGGALSWYLAAKQKLQERSEEQGQATSFIIWSVFTDGLKKAFPVHNEQCSFAKC